MVENEEQCVSKFIFILFWRATGNVPVIDVDRDRRVGEPMKSYII